MRPDPGWYHVVLRWRVHDAPTSTAFLTDIPAMRPTRPTTPLGGQRSERLARAATEILAPAVLATALPMVVATHADGIWPGLAWGLLAALFSAVLPYAFIWCGVRRGRLTDHHIGVRRQRRTPLMLGLLSVLTGLLLLVLLGAPHEVAAVVVVMFVVGAVVTAVNEVWKVSVHSAVAAGCLTVLVIVFGPSLLAAVPLVVLVAWSRVRLRDHTIAQVLAGTAVGIPLAAITFVPLAG